MAPHLCVMYERIVAYQLSLSGQDRNIEEPLAGLVCGMIEALDGLQLAKCAPVMWVLVLPGCGDFYFNSFPC